MKYSLVNGERREAEKGLAGLCIGCGQPMISKCGLIKVKHWAHKSKCECDHWWENETEWHRSWKNNFPVECQEIRHKAEDGEWHIADVKTKQGLILEFQHSFLQSDERQSRNNFYGDKLLWVVDGLKRSKDRSIFNAVLENARVLYRNILLASLPSDLGSCSLLKEWSDCKVPVFFDFGLETPLWCLLPRSSKDNFYILPFQRQDLILLLNGALTINGLTFADLMKLIIDSIFFYENPSPQTGQHQITTRLPQYQRQVILNSNPSRQYLSRLNKSGRRYRL